LVKYNDKNRSNVKQISKTIKSYLSNTNFSNDESIDKKVALLFVKSIDMYSKIINNKMTKDNIEINQSLMNWMKLNEDKITKFSKKEQKPRRR